MHPLMRNVVRLSQYAAVLWMSGLEAAFHPFTRYCAQASRIRHRNLIPARRALRSRHSTDSHAGSGQGHAGYRYAWAAHGAGRQRHAVAHV